MAGDRLTRNYLYLHLTYLVNLRCPSSCVPSFSPVPCSFCRGFHSFRSRYACQLIFSYFTCLVMSFLHVLSYDEIFLQVWTLLWQRPVFFVAACLSVLCARTCFGSSRPSAVSRFCSSFAHCPPLVGLLLVGLPYCIGAFIAAIIAE